MIHEIITKAFEKCSFQRAGAPFYPETRGERLYIPPALLRLASFEAFKALAFCFREPHLALLSDLLLCSQGAARSQAEANERFVIQSLLENAVIAADGEFALCQDTGTAIIYGWKGEDVFTGADDRAELEGGMVESYKKHNLRASQTVPSSFFAEYNTCDNSPAQIRIEAAGPEKAYRFLFTAKGGGSSNKTSYFSMTPALLEKGPFENFLKEQITRLGTAACPPYRLAVVVGGTSPEYNLEIQKLASTEILDAAPYFGGNDGCLIHRDRYWERRAMEIGRDSGLGAQFGGSSLLLDARVLRLPRHAASCPVSIGVSCSAHRSILAVIDQDGLKLEKTVNDPAAFLAKRGIFPGSETGSSPRISLDRPMAEICGELAAYAPGEKVLLSGKLVVARDAAHLAWHRLLAEGKPLPGYLFSSPLYYAGPAGTPPGRVIGSLGPTTAARMDPYSEELMSRGAGLVTLGKGGRSAAFADCCRKHGGFYLGTIGGAAALLARDHVLSAEVIDYPELGMEAVHLITVRDLPAFIVISSNEKK